VCDGLDWFFTGTGDLTPGKVAAELTN